MFGVGLILILAVMGGLIAFLGDRLGSKVGKKKLTLFGLRPYYTSILMTIISGIAVASVTMGALTWVSADVRTALFGMNKLREEISSLNSDKLAVTAQLSEQSARVEELDAKITQASVALTEANEQKNAARSELMALQKSFREAEAALATTKGQVADLSASRGKLQGEVKELEEATKKLRAGLIAVREGDVIFRSGEVLYAAVLKGGLEKNANEKQMIEFLTLANTMVLQKMQVRQNVQALWIPEKMVKVALKALAQNKGDVYVRVNAAANILSGEMVVSILEMVTNRKVFADGEKILSQRINVVIDSQQPEQALLAFLQDVNRQAVGAGVLSDPLSGKVGVVDAREMENLSLMIRKLGGKVEITGRAKGDIFVSGPVLLNMDVSAYE